MTKSNDTPASTAPGPNIPVPSTPTPEDITLTIKDLSTAAQIISVVTSRGAIKAEEMEVVGALYTKLNGFLKASAAAKQAADEKLAEDAKETTATPSKTPAEKTGAGDGAK